MLSDLALSLRNSLLEVKEINTSFKEVDNTIELAGIEVRPGIYSRGKETAKAFLLVTPDGEAFYENKSGDRKKLTDTAFLTHWNKGLSVLVTDKLS